MTNIAIKPPSRHGGYLMPRGKPDLSHLPREEVSRGRAFGLLLREALFRGNMKQSDLAEATGLRPGTISVLCNDGYDKQLDKIRQPETSTIAKIALATGMDENALREAAGYAKKQRPMLRETEGNLVREVPPDSVQLLDYYERLPPGPLREMALEQIKGLHKLAGADFKDRTDIVGKPPPDDEITRIAEE